MDLSNVKVKELSMAKPNKIGRLRGSVALENLIASQSDPKSNLDDHYAKLLDSFNKRS